MDVAKSCRAGLAGWVLLALGSCGGQETQPGAGSAALPPSEVQALEPKALPLAAAVPNPPSDTGAAAEPATQVDAKPGARRGLVAPDRGRRKPGAEVAAPAEGRRPRGLRPAGVSLRAGDTREFGTVPQGTLLRHEFELESTGEGALVFQSTKTTCECATKAHLWREDTDGVRTELAQGETIAPGQRFFLEVESLTDAARGPFHSSVVLNTNAGPVHVELMAFVQPILDLVPASISLGRITSADAAEGTATVRSSDGRPFRLEVAHSTVAHFTPDLVPIDPDPEGRASEWRVDVHLAPSPLTGVRPYRLLLASDLATGATSGSQQVDFHCVELVSVVEVTEVFRAQPEFLTFGRVTAGQAVTVTAEVECLGEVGFPAETRLFLEPVPGQPLPPEGCVAFELHRRADGRTAELEARLLGLPQGSAGSYGAILVVSAGLPRLPDLKLRLYLSCAAGQER